MRNLGSNRFLAESGQDNKQRLTNRRAEPRNLYIARMTVSCCFLTVGREIICRLVRPDTISPQNYYYYYYYYY